MITQIGTSNFKTLKTDINEINDGIKLLGGHMTPKLGRYVENQIQPITKGSIGRCIHNGMNKIMRDWFRAQKVWISPHVFYRNFNQKHR